MEKKLRVIRFIPTIVVSYPGTGTSIETSCVLYDDLFSAKDSLKRMIKIYGRYDRCKILRSDVVRKVIEL